MQKGLGSFILVCANATVHEDMFDEFRPALEQQYQELYEHYRKAFVDGYNVDVVDELDNLLAVSIEAQ